MGFDLIGANKRSAKGKYFRNNVWFWRPLVEYVRNNCDIPKKDIEGWRYNNGFIISKEQAISIADKLEELIKIGHTAKYKRKYDQYLKELPLVKCDLCKGTGNRNDEHLKGKCNGCNGKGKTKDFSTNYPFTVENVKEFAEFARKSGGFAIY